MELIAGLDEAGRGSLFGPLFVGCVIWDNNIIHKDLKDSKKISAKKRIKMAEFIKQNAISYSIEMADVKEIEFSNILKANMNAMHRAISKLSKKPDKLIIDGGYFRPYQGIPHECIIKADSSILCVSCASILAKVAHDEFIMKLILENKELEKYDLQNNMGYGTAKHIQAIKEYGYTEQHRKTFKIKKLDSIPQSKTDPK